MTISAQHHHLGTRSYHLAGLYTRPYVYHYVEKNVTVSKTTNRLSKHERLEMAIAYMKSHISLNVKQYSKMTCLTKETAEAELDVFASNPKNNIRMVLDGKKKVYRLA